MSLRYSPSVARLTPYAPGLSAQDVASEFGVSPSEVVKLGSGENPFGPSPAAARAISEDLGSLNRYPEWTSAELRCKVAGLFDVSEEEVVCGAGETEIISCVIRAFARPGDEILMHKPTFPIYHLYAEAEDRRPVFADPGDLPTLSADDLLEQINERTRAVFLTSPHNPSGRVLELDDVRRVCRAASQALVVMDEAYIHFSDRISALRLLPECPNLMVLRTFSKAYGLASLRVGFGIAGEEVVRILMRIKPTWNVGALQTAGAVAALDDEEHVERITQIVGKMREVAYREIDSLGGFSVIKGSQANFVLVRLDDPSLNSTEVFRRLARQGLVVKDGTVSYIGLGTRHLRIDVGVEEVMDRLVEALRTISASS
jgi:histidinol-phosphate aminotransferase